MPDNLRTNSHEYEEPTTAEKLSKLPYGIGFNTANSIFVQLTFYGSVFVLYLNTLGFNKTQIGFLLSLLDFLVVVSLFSGSIVDRWGTKRTSLSFWTYRTVVTVGLLFVPLVLNYGGQQAALIFIAAITACFSILRAIALTGLLPWQQEYIPLQIRGKFFAYSRIAISLAGLFAMGISGFMLNRFSGLGGYSFLFGLGLVSAVFAILFATRLPGGKARPPESRPRRRFWSVLRPLSDRGFLLFLCGSALIIVATVPLASFLPLYMKEIVGLSSGDIVYLGMGALLGGVLTSLFWGWASDRYGSRPVMISGLLFLAFYPVLLMLIPRHSEASLPIALGVYFYGGFATMGWSIGSSRLLFSSLVPPKKGPDYSAVYHSWLGVFGGLSILLGGMILDQYSDIQLSVLGFSVGAYTILFLAGILLPLLAVLLLRLVRADSAFSMGEFAGLFYHGNPIRAMESMIRFHRTREESAIISITESLGQSHSPLTIEELLVALDDPRFLVRFEALVSIGRHGPDDRLRAALVEVLRGEDPALNVLACWALGRMRDSQALEPLRAALDSPYRSVRAHAARSLAGLDDREGAPLLEARLEEESDPGLRLVYAASLAKLDDIQVIPVILELMCATRSEMTVKEMALALARLIGNESSYILLLRQVSADPGTAMSQTVSGLIKKIDALPVEMETLDVAEQCAGAFARQDLDRGVLLLTALAGKLPETQIDAPFRPVLKTCISLAKTHQSAQLEYSILILHLLLENL